MLEISHIILLNRVEISIFVFSPVSPLTGTDHLSIVHKDPKTPPVLTTTPQRSKKRKSKRSPSGRSPDRWKDKTPPRERSPPRKITRAVKKVDSASASECNAPESARSHGRVTVWFKRCLHIAFFFFTLSLFFFITFIPRCYNVTCGLRASYGWPWTIWSVVSSMVNWRRHQIHTPARQSHGQAGRTSRVHSVPGLPMIVNHGRWRCSAENKEKEANQRQCLL